jgi:hypothetical protein
MRVVEEGYYFFVYRKRKLMNVNFKREERRSFFEKDVETMTCHN